MPTPPVIVSTPQQTIIDKICTDTEAILRLGAETPTDPLYVKKNEDYTKLTVDGQPAVPDAVPPLPAKTGAEVQQQTIEGIRNSAVATVMALSTEGSTLSASPSLSFSAATTVLTAPVTVTTARKALVAFSGSFSASAALRADFYIIVGSTPYTPAYKQYIIVPSSYSSFSGTWVVNLPAGASNVLGVMVRGSGTGNILLDGNCYVQISVIG